MNNSEPIYDTGVIHGRFQVLHNDHLKYLLAGKDHCNKLVVGITNPDPRLTQFENADPKRSDPLANPLTYYERHTMVEAALVGAGIQRRNFIIVPFPINLPDRYAYYVPMDAVFFLTIYDDWGRRKLQYLKNMGLATFVLWEVPPHQKGISGSQIRYRMAKGQPWEHMVPECIVPMIESWGIVERLKKLNRRLTGT
jgi:nicotinamide-nucleotide adenylyltransferase